MTPSTCISGISSSSQYCPPSRPITSHHGPLTPPLFYTSSKLDSNEDNLDRLTWRGLSGTIGAGYSSPPNGSGASFWTCGGVDGTSTLVPTIFWTHACYCMCRRSNAIVSTIRVSYSGKFVDCGCCCGHCHIFNERALTNFIAGKKWRKYENESSKEGSTYLRICNSMF